MEHWIADYGYPIFFLMGLLGTTFLPVPDPVFFYSSGYLAARLSLSPLLSFLLGYIGLMGSLYGKYLLGRYGSKRILAFIEKRKRYAGHMKKSEALVEKHGALSIGISYFLPFVRHMLPFFLGVTRYPMKRYVWVTFAFGFLWTLVLFWFGYST